MVEGCLLSFTGAALGLGVAVAGVRALIAAYPDSLPRSADVALDLGVLAFTLVIGLATGAVFGLAPLLHLRAGRDVAGAQGRRHAHDGRRRAQPDPPRAGRRRSRARRRARHRRGAAAAHGDEPVERRLRASTAASSSRSRSRCRDATYAKSERGADVLHAAARPAARRPAACRAWPR